MIRIVVLLELFYIIVNTGGRAASTEEREHVNQPMCADYLELLHIHYIQGVASQESQFIASMKGGLLRIIDLLFKTTAKEVYSGVSYFTRKQAQGSRADTCWTAAVPSWANNPKAAYDSLAVVEGERIENSQLDALYGAATKIDWNVPKAGGKRLIIMFTLGFPETHARGFGDFEPYESCEEVDHPPLSVVESVLQAENIPVVYIVQSIEQWFYYVKTFRAQHPKAVILQSANTNAMEWRLKGEISRLICDSPNTPTRPLQVLYVVDNSYDTLPNLDLRTVRDILRFLMIHLSGIREHFEVALASFVDRPIFDHGQFGVDYCYKEHVQFTTNITDIEREINNLQGLSGIDFRESQFDALKAGIESTSIGWKDESWLKVVIIGTDSIPHEKVEGSDINLATEECPSPQYPSRSELREIIRQYNNHDVVPIALVSNYLRPYWIDIMKDLSENGIVIGVRDDHPNEIALSLAAALTIGFN